MLAHSASRFMQRIGKKTDWVANPDPNYVCFDAYKAKYVHTAMTFKILFRRLSKLHVFLMGNSPA